MLTRRNLVRLAAGLIAASGCQAGPQGHRSRAAPGPQPTASLGDCSAAAFPGADPMRHLARAEGDDFIEILDVAHRDDLIFACTGTQGITTWNAAHEGGIGLLSDGIGPRDLAHPRFPRCHRMALKPDRSELAISQRGDEIQPRPFLATYDFSNPSSPELIATWSGVESVEGLVFVGDRIVAAAHRSGVIVFERSGATFRRVGGYADTASDAWQPAKLGTDVIVAEGETGLRVYAVGEVGLRLRATVALRGSSKDVAVSPPFAFVATSVGLAVVDLSDPDHPRVASEVATPSTSVGVASGAKGMVFVADWDELRAYDVTDPTSPRLAASEVVPTGGAFSRVLAVDADRDGRVFAGEWQGLHTYAYDASAPAPEIEVEGEPVVFGAVPDGERSSHTIEVHNRGRAQLSVGTIGSSDPAVGVDAQCFALAPGESRELEVTWAPGRKRTVEAVLTIESNDADESPLSISVSGNPVGLGIGDPIASFDVLDLEGRRWTSDALQGKVVLLAYFATF